MSSDCDADEEAVFHAALEIDDPEVCARYLDDVCGTETELRRRIERLLRAYQVARPKFEGEGLAFNPRDLAASDERNLESPGTLIGRYRLIEQIGEGGFGSVYLAEQTEPVQRSVVLKIIKAGMDTRQVVARFEAERQALALMDHAHIAKVHDAGATDSGRPYFVMEWVEGTSITDFCREEPVDLTERLGLFVRVCQAVQHAHQKGIIHRDLKPSNILVRRRDEDGVPVPKVIDFGIAKATQGQFADGTLLTRAEQILGTPAYMSPEQAGQSGVDIDTRSDVYSLGVVLYELLAGVPPFDPAELRDAGLEAMHRIIRERDPVRPSTRISKLAAPMPDTKASVLAPGHLPADLDWIVMKCLEKERSRRYETVNGLALDIVRHLHHEPVLARPPSAVYRLQKAWRRHRLAFAGALVVTLTLLMGIGVSSWQARVATRANAIADAEREKAEEAALRLESSLARQLLSRGQVFCEQGKVADGLHWMVRASEGVPPHETALKRDIINNLRAWSGEWVEPVAGLLHASNTTLGGFSSDGSMAVTGGYDGTLSLWAIPSGERLWSASGDEVHGGRQLNLARFIGEDGRLVTAGGDGRVRLWKASKGGFCVPLGQAIEVGPGGNPVASEDGKWVAVAGATEADDGSVRHWIRVHSGLDGRFLFEIEPEYRVERIYSDPAGGKLLVLINDRREGRFWELPGGRPLGTPMAFGQAIVHTAVAFHPHGQVFAVGDGEGRLHLWSAEEGVEIGRLNGHERRIKALQFHPDPTVNLLVTASEDGMARLWNWETGETVGPIMRHERAIFDVAFSPDGQWLVTSGIDQTARLWASDTAEPLGPPLRHNDSYVTGAEVSPDGKHLLTLVVGQVSTL